MGFESVPMLNEDGTERIQKVTPEVYTRMTIDPANWLMWEVVDDSCLSDAQKAQIETSKESTRLANMTPSERQREALKREILREMGMLNK